jgi:phosphatidylinositol alpha-1,6-mannosyltransferase
VPLYGSDLLAGGRAYRLLLRFLLRRARRLFPISRFTRSLAEQLGVDTRRAVLIPPGVDVHPFEQEPAEGAENLLALCKNRRILLTAGRLVRRKGVLEFVRDAMPELIRRFPDLLFLVVGDDGAQSLIHKKEGMRRQIEDVIRRQGLEHRSACWGACPTAT